LSGNPFFLDGNVLAKKRLGAEGGIAALIKIG